LPTPYSRSPLIPPTVAVSINKNNLTHDFIKESRAFSASVLCQGTPLSFIGCFGFKSGGDTDKFEGINYKIGETGALIVLDNAVSYLEARVTKEMDVGTHTIFVGEVVNADVISDEVCMTYDYYHQIKGGKTPKAAATYLDEKKMGQVPKEEKPKWRNTNAPSAAIYMTRKRATPMAV